MNRLLFSFVISAFLVTGCSDIMPLNSARPSYIKHVAAHKEGSDGSRLYCFSRRYWSNDHSIWDAGIGNILDA